MKERSQIQGFEIRASGDERPSYEALEAAMAEIMAGRPISLTTRTFIFNALDFLYLTFLIEDRPRRPGARPAVATWAAANAAAQLVTTHRAASLREAASAVAAVFLREPGCERAIARIERAYRKIKAGEPGAQVMEISAAVLEEAGAYIAGVRASPLQGNRVRSRKQ